MNLPPAFGSEDAFWDEPDFLLTYIVTALVNGMGLEIGITLTLRGAVISGTLTSEHNYLAYMTRSLQAQIDFDDANVPQEARRALNDLLDVRIMAEFDPAETFQQPSDSDAADESELPLDDLPPPIQFMHLKDPMIVNANPPVAFGEGSDTMLRLRLMAVDGWMLGRLLPDMPDFPDFGDPGLTH